MNQDNEKSLFKALSTGDLNKLNSLIIEGVDINRKYGKAQRTPLMIAILHYQTDIIDRLLEENVTISFSDEKYGSTALIYAVQCNQKQTLCKLLTLGGNFNFQRLTDDCTALHIAVRNDYAEIFHALLSRGADVAIRDSAGYNVLHTAVDCDRLSMVETICSDQAKGIIDAADYEGWTPLHVACSLGRKEILSILLEHGANVNALTNDSQTPLMLAASSNCVEICKELLSRGADVNKQDSDGDTALHLAVTEGYSAIINCLLENNADRIIKNNKGHTPLDISKTRGFHDLTVILHSQDNWTFESTDGSNKVQETPKTGSKKTPQKSKKSTKYEKETSVSNGLKSNENVFVKEVNLLKDAFDVNKLRQEVESLRRLKQKNVCVVISLSMTSTKGEIAMERIKGRTIDDVIKKEGLSSYQDKIVPVYLQQILTGLHYLNLSLIVHGYLIPEHIMVTDDDVVILTGFSFGRKFVTPKNCRYCSPEIHNSEEFTHKSDVWAVGCLAYELANKKPPYFNLNATTAAHLIRLHEMPDILEDKDEISNKDELVNIYRKSVTRTLSLRPTATDLLELLGVAEM